MKTYKPIELTAIAKQQGYKLCCLENSRGERLQPFNKVTVPINKQMEIIKNRLAADLFPDGIYYMLFAHSISKSKNPDKYPIVKGKVSKETLNEQQPITIVQSPNNEVLSWEAALAYQKEISDLKSEVKTLQMEIAYLNQQLEEEDDSLKDGENKSSPENSIVTFLKETIPAFIPMFDKHFELQERKLNLEEMKLNKKPVQMVNSKQAGKPIVVGTQEHMNLIESYFNSDNEDALNRELDKLEAYDENLYKQVCQTLGIEIEEGGQNEH